MERSEVEDALDRIIAEDVDGLLDAPEKPKPVTEQDRLHRAFAEIVDFYREHGREPSSSTRQISERKLGARLDGLRASEEKIEQLRAADSEFGLLSDPKPPESLDEVLANDDLDLLDDPTGILDVSSLPEVRNSPAVEGEKAERVKAKDFEMFEPLFKTKHEELRSGAWRLSPFKGIQTIKEGQFFVLGGVMCFVAEVGEPQKVELKGGPKTKERLRVVFENGTESAMYRQSLAVRLGEKDGLAVTRSAFDVTEIGDADTESGHIYVLRSLSTDPEVAGLRDLYKIGFSTGPVAKRIAGAEKSSTYLMAPVEIVASYRAYNLRPSALEHLIHRVFAAVRLNAEIIGADGTRITPREWFVAPLKVINEAIERIMTGDIVHYVYDPAAQALVKR